MKMTVEWTTWFWLIKVRVLSTFFSLWVYGIVRNTGKDTMVFYTPCIYIVRWRWPALCTLQTSQSFRFCSSIGSGNALSVRRWGMSEPCVMWRGRGRSRPSSRPLVTAIWKYSWVMGELVVALYRIWLFTSDTSRRWKKIRFHHLTDQWENP